LTPKGFFAKQKTQVSRQIAAISVQKWKCHRLNKLGG